MKFKSNKKEVLKAIGDKEKLALEAIGQYVKGQAKLLAPVDTGNLESSIDHRVKDTSVAIGTNVEYAIYQEKGTRFQPAQPFLEPSVTNNRNNIKNLAERYLKE